MKRRAIPMVLGIVIFASWLFLSNPQKIIDSISKANLYFVLLGVVLTLATTSIKSIRWKILLKDINLDIPFGLAFSTFSSGLFISLLTPGRLAEPVRAYLLKKKIGSSVSEALPLIVAERILDLLTILSLSVASLLTLGFLVSPQIAFFLNISAIFTIFILFLAIVALVYRSFGEFLVNFIIKLPKMGKFKEKIEYVLKNFYKSSSKIRKRTILFAIALTISAWLIEGAILFFAAKSLGFEISFLIGVEIMALSQLIGLLSSLPGGLGSLETVMSLLLAPFLVGSAAVTLIYRFTTIWVSVALGFLLLVRMFGFRRIFESVK